MFELHGPRTRAVYLSHLRSAARELACSDADLVAALQLGPESGRDTLVQWVTATQDAGLSPATVRGRIAAFRAVIAESRNPYQLPRLRVARPGRARYSLTPEDVRRLVVTARATLSSVSAARCEAAIRCMFEVGLRVGELVSILVDDVESDAVSFVQKGGERIRVTLPPTTADAVRRMRDATAIGGRTLFVTSSGRPWSARAVRSQIATVALASLGRSVPPHALRHAGVTAILRATGNARGAARWARHRDVRVTLAIYDDDVTDVAGQLAADLGAMLALPPPAAPVEPRKLPGG